jgi:hypothetical protein
MTQLLQLPAPLPPRHDRVPPPAWLTGLAAGLLAAASGVVACLGIAVAGWLTGTSGSVGGALGVGAAGWLLAHGHVLDLGSASISLVPLGLTALLTLLLVRSAEQPHGRRGWRLCGPPGCSPPAARSPMPVSCSWWRR